MAVSSMATFQALDSASWHREHWKLFTLISMNFLLDGVLFSIVPLLLFLVRPQDAPVILLVNSAAFLAGAFALGRLADLRGRRLMFLASQVFDLAGAALLIPFHNGFHEILILTSLINFGVGGEVGATYAALAELAPSRHRGKAMMLATNFWNIGASIIAALALAIIALSTEEGTQVQSMLLSTLALAVFITVARIQMPESPRWLSTRGRLAEAERIVRRFGGTGSGPPAGTRPALSEPAPVALRSAFRKYRFRLVILLTITTAQLLTYNMVAYYAPFARGFAYGIDTTPILILTANLGASAGAFLLLPLIDRNRRTSATLSFAGGLTTSVALLALHGGGFPVFLAALLINFLFSEWAWASLSVLESELFPTGVRASAVGFVTATAWLGNTLVIFVETRIDATLFLTLASVLWLAGLAAALAWQRRGIESAKRTLEELA